MTPWISTIRQEETMKHNQVNRRDFLKLAGLGGAVFASGLSGWSHAAQGGNQDDFISCSYPTPIGVSADRR
jgi:hypothetical protein